MTAGPMAAHDGDELIQYGAAVAFELPAIPGAGPPEVALREAAARVGLDTDGRDELHAYIGWLNGFVHTGRNLRTRALASLGEVPA